MVIFSPVFVCSGFSGLRRSSSFSKNVAEEALGECERKKHINKGEKTKRWYSWCRDIPTIGLFWLAPGGGFPDRNWTSRPNPEPLPDKIGEGGDLNSRQIELEGHRLRH